MPRDGGQPYPFFLAHQLDAAPDAFDAKLGPPADWLVEWKYDGIRAQAVKRAGRVWLWSRGEELVSETFPDALKALAALPDGTVLDGELLVWPEGSLQPAPFAVLQKRLNRKVIGAKLLAEAPVRFVAYDLLEDGGVDVRALPQAERRARLEARLQATTIAPVAAGAGRRLGRRWPPCAHSRASAASKASCSSTARPPTAAGAPRPRAPGGSGRSTR